MESMQKRVVLLLVVSALMVTSSCLTDEETQIVASRNVCVNLDQYQEGPRFSDAVVCDLFKQRLNGLMHQHGAGPKDIVSVGVVSASYKVTSFKGRDRTLSASVFVARQDVPNGPITDGPAPFMDLTALSLKDAKGKPTDATLMAPGVQLVNRALLDLVWGGDPRIVLLVDSTHVTPTPTPQNPLDFGWLACVRFQAVVTVGGSGGGGSLGSDWEPEPPDTVTAPVAPWVPETPDTMQYPGKSGDDHGNGVGNGRGKRKGGKK
jgi:hypothetical protein